MAQFANRIRRPRRVIGAPNTSFKYGARCFRLNGAAQESNLPSVGLRRVLILKTSWGTGPDRSGAEGNAAPTSGSQVHREGDVTSGAFGEQSQDADALASLTDPVVIQPQTISPRRIA